MSRTLDMTKGNTVKLLLQFALPLILSNLGQQLYMIADAAIVGRGVGVAALAAVGSADWSYWLALWTVLGFTQGFSTFIARAFGKGDHEGMNRTIAASVLLTLALGAVLTVVGVIGARPLLILLDTPEDILPMAVTYLVTMLAGMIPVAAYNMASAILRALGDGRTPLLAMLIAAVLNIGLDLLFVLGFSWGVFGAALASVLAQTVSFFYCLFVILRLPLIRIGRAVFRSSLVLLRPLLAFGIPLSLQYIVIALGGMLLQSTVNAEGSIFVAGFTATNKLYGLLECSAISLGIAMATLLSQNFGAQQYARVRQGVFVGTLLSVTAAVLVSLIVLPLSRPLLSLFLDTAKPGADEAMAIAHRYLLILLLTLPILYLIHVYRNALQSIGNASWSMLSGGAEFCVRVGMAKLIAPLFGVDILYYIEPLAWVGALVFVIPPYWYYRGHKLRNTSLSERTPPSE